MTSSALSASFECLCYGSTAIINILNNWTSESDVHRFQILTSKNGPRAERVKHPSTFHLLFHFFINFLKQFPFQSELELINLYMYTNKSQKNQ